MKNYRRLVPLIVPLIVLLLALIFLQGCEWNDFSVVTWEKYDEVIPPEPVTQEAQDYAMAAASAAFPWAAAFSLVTDALRFRSKYIGTAVEEKVGLKSYSVIRLLGGRKGREVWPEAIKAR